MRPGTGGFRDLGFRDLGFGVTGFMSVGIEVFAELGFRV